MKKNYAGIFLLALGLGFLLFRAQITTLLLGGPPKVQESVWIEDRQVYEKVSGIVGWCGWALGVAGITNLIAVAVLSRMRRSKSNYLH